MDTLTVLIIAVVTFVVFVLLTAYFLKMAMLMGKESRRKARPDSEENRPQAAEKDDKEESVPSKLG